MAKVYITYFLDIPFRAFSTRIIEIVWPSLVIPKTPSRRFISLSCWQSSAPLHGLQCDDVFRGYNDWPSMRMYLSNVKWICLMMLPLSASLLYRFIRQALTTWWHRYPERRHNIRPSMDCILIFTTEVWIYYVIFVWNHVCACHKSVGNCRKLLEKFIQPSFLVNWKTRTPWQPVRMLICLHSRLFECPSVRLCVCPRFPPDHCCRPNREERF